MAPRPARLASGLLVLTLLALGACDRSGSDDQAGPGTTAAAPAPTAPAPAVTTTSGAPTWSDDTKTGPGDRSPPDGSSAKLTAVRAAGHDGFDRVVFQFEGTKVPGYRIGYADQITLGESDDEFLTLRGGALIQATFQGTASDDHRPGTQTVPDTLTLGLAQVQQVGLAEDWEGIVRLGVGLDHQAGFRVLELRDPVRVVVDVAA
jgi:hypothetical protein